MTTGIIRPTTPAEAVARARSMVGYQPPRPPGAPPDWKPAAIQYRLEKNSGGDDPNAPHPAEWSYGHRIATCDCVGLVAWALGFSRFHPEFAEYGGHVNTTSMLLDALGENSFFEETRSPRPGDAIVYGGLYDDDGERVRPGHVGLVVGIPEGWSITDPWRRLTAVHCSSGNQRRTGSAIRYGDGQLWRSRDGLVLRYVRAAE